MKKNFILQTISEWEECKQTIFSSFAGLLIFKFSPQCPISRSVTREFDAWYEALPEDVALTCVKVDVINARPLSQQLAQELHIPHESPQVIWLTPDLHVHWHASHWAITREALHTQLQRKRSELK